MSIVQGKKKYAENFLKERMMECDDPSPVQETSTSSDTIITLLVQKLPYEKPPTLKSDTINWVKGRRILFIHYGDKMLCFLEVLGLLIM